MEFKTAVEMHEYTTKRHTDDVNKELENIFNEISDASEFGKYTVVIDKRITDDAEKFLVDKGYTVKFDNCNNESYTTISW